MVFFIGRPVDRASPEGPVAPGAYEAPPPEDGGVGVVQWTVGGVCDQVPPFPKSVSGIVTLTHVPSSSNDRVEGSYQVDPSGGPSGFTEGSFSAHSCP